jgi:hypothetical protein
MPVLYKVLGQVAPAANTANIVYTVPAATSSVISTINVCNPDASARTFRIAVVPNGTTLDAKSYICYEAPVGAYDSISLTMGITLAANDSISVFSLSSSNVAFNIFGSQIT